MNSNIAMSDERSAIRRKTGRLSPVACRQSGFTVIEALVSATIFAVASVSITGVYIAVQRLNQASRSLVAVQQNGRYLMEDIAKIVRNGQVDYARYDALESNHMVPQPSAQYLYLIDRDGTQVRIAYNAGNQTVTLQKGTGTVTNYVGSEVKVLDFRAYVWPRIDPYPAVRVFGVTPDEQPTVTVFVSLESNQNPRYVERAQMQTTVATRQYSR